ncbi:hypothetical protein MVEG_01352 [Podila verticillata NRRL 6337]|nr:hypothetical protein MVEG_01352 [Podila verticillata NRRL 6337]
MPDLREIRVTDMMEDDSEMEVDSENDEGRDSDSDAEIAEDGRQVREESIWSRRELYHGLVPTELVEDWKLLFATDITTARYMVDRFAMSIEEFGRTEIWNRRCDATIAWERTIDITARDKKAKSCSGNDAFNEEPRYCLRPTEEAIDRTADMSVQQSYLGQRHLHVMEREGIKFITAKDPG